MCLHLQRFLCKQGTGNWFITDKISILTKFYTLPMTRNSCTATELKVKDHFQGQI